MYPAPGGRAVISSEKVSEMKRIRKESGDSEDKPNHPSLPFATEPHKGKVNLPFEPLTVVFLDLQYYVDVPSAMKEHGFSGKKLQLMYDVTGTFRPGVLIALMGITGAGKTTLLDVLAGRKTSGTVEGEIKIGGYPKVQKTFARVSGYCEQNDIHSSQITVEESVMFSAWLRLDPSIDSETKSNFVKEVLETVELDKVKDALVGLPGVVGLSPEQRKRLTLAVELVANPSIIFLDELTTGLDARSAAIVMRAVKKVAETRRTIVCTIHQPSIDIFEAFDEVLLLKAGGRTIYCGPLGQHSCKVIEYFESITGVPKIEKNYNPATWMLEVSSTSSEAELGVDFADIYQHSDLLQNNKELAKTLSSPPPGTKDLAFPTEFPQNGWGQFKACLWKQHWSYWRSPSYNMFRLLFIMVSSLMFGALFWKQGKKLNVCGLVLRACSGHHRVPLYLPSSGYIFCHFVPTDWVFWLSLQSFLAYVFHVLFPIVFQLFGYDDCCNYPKLSSGCNITISFLCSVQSVFWVHSSSTANSKMVALVILFDSYILVAKWFANFTIWRYS